LNPYFSLEDPEVSRRYNPVPEGADIRTKDPFAFMPEKYAPRDPLDYIFATLFVLAPYALAAAVKHPAIYPVLLIPDIVLAAAGVRTSNYLQESYTSPFRYGGPNRDPLSLLMSFPTRPWEEIVGVQYA